MKLPHSLRVSLLLFLSLLAPVPAPVPRCSPWIIINKLVEWTSLWSDSNAYFPIGPCEYGGPIGALLAGDTASVFLLESPEKIPRHNIYELVWFLKTGLLRMKRMLLGLEPFEADINILLEGYQHYTPNVRTTQLGHGTQRRPELIDDKNLFNKFVGGKVLSLFVDGPEFLPNKYTPVGPLRRSRQPQRRRRRPGQLVRGAAHRHTRRRRPAPAAAAAPPAARALELETGGWRPVVTPSTGRGGASDQ